MLFSLSGTALGRGILVDLLSRCLNVCERIHSFNIWANYPKGSATLCRSAIQRRRTSKVCGKPQNSAPHKKLMWQERLPVGSISVVTLIRTDTTLDHSQKAEQVQTNNLPRNSYETRTLRRVRPSCVYNFRDEVMWHGIREAHPGPFDELNRCSHVGSYDSFCVCGILTIWFAS